MDKVDIIIIGAGVVGLAAAQELSRKGKSVVLLERNDGFGKETSSRNSEVIHGGFYYPTGSLKARLCVEGNRVLYEFCGKNEIPHRKIGKLLIANNEQEERKIRKLYETGKANGVEDLVLLDKKGIISLEPQIGGHFGMYSPSTGIIDTHALMKRFEQIALAHEVMIGYGCTVKGLANNGGSWTVEVLDTDGATTQLCSERVINAAGLFADSIASLAGIDIDAEEYRIHWCKGEYFSVSGRHKGRLSHLVYPAPTPVSLGVHGVLGLDGRFKLGPSAFFVDAIDYSVDPAHRDDFYDAASLLFPFLEPDDLSPDMAGIRPKLQRHNDEFRDFIIRDESAKGFPGFINLVGIESPGLTSALSIAAMIGRLSG